jgi:uncharacterized protein (TIGR04255 family)
LIPIGVQLSEILYPKLTRSPLREAIVDIRLPEMLSTSVTAAFKPPEGFDVTKEIKQGQFNFSMEMDKPFEAKVLEETLLGWRYENDDASIVVQLRRNGLTYSILKNYPGWNRLRDAARDEWQRFLAFTGPVKTSRLAVRYINAISIPLGADYDDYLTTGPKVPESVPPVVTGFLQRVLIPFADEAATAIFTQTLETSGAGAIVDIDVISECSLDGSSADVWSKLEELHQIADRIFFASLKAKVLESFQ